MIELVFEGYSDDTFGEYKHFRDDHDNCADGTRIQYLVYDPDTDEGLIVSGLYGEGEDGGWSIGISPRDTLDEKPIPEWPIHFTRGEREYSAALHIQAPDNVTLNLVSHPREEE